MSEGPTAMPSHQKSPYRRMWTFVVVFCAVAAGGATVYWLWVRQSADQGAAEKLNDRGVALMEQFRYGDAVAVFDEVVKSAPRWLPGRINLGIALMNQGSTDTTALARSQTVFQEILTEEPDNPYAHFCLGIMASYGKDLDVAVQHFEAVHRKDPRDPHTLCWLAEVLPPGSDRGVEYCRQALAIQPAFRKAIYVLQQHFNRQAAIIKDQGKKAEAKRQATDLTKRFNDLDKTRTGALFGMKYTEMGRYAEVIGKGPAKETSTGPLPLFQQHDLTIKLAAGARWATPADLGDDAVGRLRAKVRARFGGTIIVFDYNGDEKPDLFLAGAVVENGKVRDLFLRNDGDWTFTDVTAAAGLAGPHPTLGANAADFDNDGRVDLLLTGAGSQRLFRNKGDGTFEDVSSKAGLDKITSVCLGSAFIDLDQDSDLDLLIAEYAATPEEALDVLDGKKPGRGSVLVFINKGESLPAKPGTNAALTCRLERACLFSDLPEGAVSTTVIAISDVDGDQDLDLLTFPERGKPNLLLNDRALRFRGIKALETVTSAAAWNGALVLDVDHDRRSDLFLISADQPPVLLLNRAGITQTDVSKWFESGATNSPKLLQAVAGDVDLDGWTDIVGLSADRVPVLLHNDGGKLAFVQQGLGADAAWPKDLLAVTLCDGDGDGFLDLLTWSEGQGLQLHRNQGNGHHALRLQTIGSRFVAPAGEPMFCDEDGIGTWVWAESDKQWAGQELTTLSAGLAQSRQPLLLGLGDKTVAAAVRLRWPDGCWQAELDVPADKLTRIAELNRKITSCPILFTWDGEKWVFITDFLGAGSVGEIGPDHTCRPPRPEESIKIEPGQLAPKDGRYLLSITEPMNEVTYLDKLQLVAIDHPAGVRVFPDERFTTSGPPASQDLIAFNREIFPASARDHRGHDLTDALRHWDRVTADGFWRRGWTGFAEEHFVELDFADRLAQFGPKERLYLCLAGWIDYPLPESIWAAHQAGIETQFPVLERQNENGAWISLGDAGFPAGLPRMMLLDVTGKLTGPRCRLRLRTNLQIYWDQVFVAAGCRTITPGGKGEVRARVLDVHQADLALCGIQKEFSPDGRKPTIYDHDREEHPILIPPAGPRTRFGEVTDLLRAKDDCFVVFGPGDELKVQFDAGTLPPLPKGWQRSFVLRTRGYCKDSGPYTAMGSTIEPLPFAALKNYPPSAEDQPPRDEKYRDYLRRYQTRDVRAPR